MYLRDHSHTIPTKKAADAPSSPPRSICDAEKARVGARLREAHDALWARVKHIYAKGGQFHGN